MTSHHTITPTWIGHETAVSDDSPRGVDGHTIPRRGFKPGRRETSTAGCGPPDNRPDCCQSPGGDGG